MRYARSVSFRSKTSKPAIPSLWKGPEALNHFMRLLLPTSFFAIAILLAYLQRRDRDRRAGLELSPEESEYYSNQESRRKRGLILLTTIAIAMAFGLLIDPGQKGKPNPIFIFLWAGILLMTAGLLSFAFLDMRANFHFARHKINRLKRERIELLAEFRSLVNRPASTPDA